MEVIQTAILSVWHMLNEMSPYLLLGFLIAGLMHSFIPGRVFTKYLSGKSFRSVVNAALLGIPLPLCSCGVIPTAMSLRREGASKGATVSFLIATPQTGVDSILATYSIMGLPFAIIRPFAALLTSLLGGQMVNIVENDDAADAIRANASQQSASQQEDSPACDLSSLFKRLLSALRYAYVEMMGDIGKWLALGIVIAGLISMVPNEYFALFKENTFASILLVLFMAVPMYLCATGSIPIAVALMLKGLTPGAALVMLMAGPASNMASIMVIGKVLGRRTLVTYLSSIIFGAIAFALLIDFVLPTEWFLPKMMMDHSACHHAAPSFFALACSVALILMLAYALTFGRRSSHPASEESCDCNPGAPSVHEVSIKGMHCSHCAEGVRKAIASIDGAENVTVDLASATARYEGNPPAEEIRKAVESIGFEVI